VYESSLPHDLKKPGFYTPNDGKKSSEELYHDLWHKDLENPLQN
jgi:hypothetical protein